MSSIVVELKNHEITKIGIDSSIDFYRTMAIDQLSFPGLDVFVTGIDSSTFNVVLDTKKNSEINVQTVNAINDFFKKYHVPWEWIVTADSKTNEFEQHGFNLLYEAPGMYFDLSKALPNIQGTIDIREAQDDLTDWIKPLQESFPSSDNCELYRKLYADLLKKGENKLRHFIAYSENEVASSATLFLSNDAVMLHDLATKNKFRKKGIGSALSCYMMNEAKKAGYKHCYLDSTDEGFNLYKRLGFKVYCRTIAYVKSKT